MTLPLLNGRAEIAPAFLAVVGDAPTRETVREVVGRFGWTGAAVRDGGAADARQLLADAPAPAVLLVDVSDCEDALAAMDALAEVCEPHTRVVAIGQTNDIGLYRGLMKMGVSDYLVKPVAAEALAEALHRAERREAADPAASKPARLLAVIGARGGVGVTSVALSLAWELAHERRQRTVLLDLDMQFGAAALALDLEPGRGLREALTNPERVDALLIGSAMIQQSERLRILAAEEPLEDDIEVGPRGLTALLAAVSETADVLVADLPRRADRLTREVLARADAVVVVTDLSLAAMRDTQRLLALLKTLRPQGGVLTLANRVGAAPGEVPQPEFEKAIGARLDFAAAMDAKAAMACAEQAKPLIAAARTGPAAETFRALVDRLTGETAPQPATPAPAASWLQRVLGR